MKKARITFSVLSYILMAILWLLAFLTNAFNMWGLWREWHIVGISFVCLAPSYCVLSILSIVFSALSFNHKSIIKNSIFLLISFLIILYTITVSSTWMW